MQSFRKTDLTVEVCQFCHKHPQMGHSELPYQQKYQQLKKQIQKYSDSMRIIQKTNFRKGAFEIWINNLLLFSKLNNYPDNAQDIKLKINQLMMIISCINNKSLEQFKRLKLKLLSAQKTKNNIDDNENHTITDKIENDLYTYLKKKNQNVRFSYKIINSLIQELLHESKKNKKQFLFSSRPKTYKYCRNNNDENKTLSKDKKESILEVDINNSKKLEFFTQRNSKLKCFDSIIASKRKINERGNTINCLYDSKRNQRSVRNLRSNIQSYFSSLDNKVNQSTFRANNPGDNIQQKKVSKYAYLTKEMDRLQDNNNICQQDIKLLELSSEQDFVIDQVSLEIVKPNSINLEELKKQEDLNLNIPKSIMENYNKGNVGTPNSEKRKYSFEFNRQFQAIQKELKSQFGSQFNKIISQSSSLGAQKISSQLLTENKIQQANICDQNQQNDNSSESFDLLGSQKSNLIQNNAISVKKILLESKKLLKSSHQIKSQKINTITSIDHKNLVEDIFEDIYGNLINQSLILKQSSEILSSFSSNSCQEQFNHQNLLWQQLPLSQIKKSTNIIFKTFLKYQMYQRIENSFNKINLSTIISYCFLIKKVYHQQLQEAFQIRDYDKISVEGFLFRIATLKSERGRKNLSLLIDLDNNFIPIKMFDCYQGIFIQMTISMALIKRVRTYVIKILQGQNFCLDVLEDWVYFVLIGFVVIRSWKKEFDLENLAVSFTETADVENKKQDNGLKALLKMINSCPSIQISPIDLRKVKRVLIDGCFIGEQNQKKDKVLLIPKITVINFKRQNFQNDIKQLTQFNEDKQNILKSTLHLIHPFFQKQPQRDDHCSQKLAYQQFVLKYQKFLVCFHPDPFYSQTIVSTNQCQELNHNPNWKIIFRINSKIFEQNVISQKRCIFQFFEFMNSVKIKEKPTKITINQIKKRMKRGIQKINLEAIGQINKKGNFFFELELQQGEYICEIFRGYEIKQTNCLKIISDTPIQILNEALDFEGGRNFCQALHREQLNQSGNEEKKYDCEEKENFDMFIKT